MTKAISATSVRKAATELAGMQRSLRGWLKYRALNDAVRSGQIPSRTGVAPVRDMATEQDLATKLYALLEALEPTARLPSPDLRANPAAAVQLAKIAVGGPMQTTATAQGATPGWMWPVAIVGGLLLAVTTAIRSAADVAKDREEKECIRAGACTDAGFWLKWATVIGLGWFAWKELGVGHAVRGYIKRGL